MLSDLRLPDGSPWAACPRTFLKDAIGTLAAEGYTLEAAFEPEFTLGRRVPDPGGGLDRLVPIDDALCYAGHRLRRRPRLHDRAHARPGEPGHAGRALPPRAGPRPAGAVRTPRARAARRRQPRPLPRDRPRRGHCAWPCGPRWPPSRWPARRATAPICTCPCGANPITFSRGDSEVREWLHRRAARPSARADRADLRQRQRLPAAGAPVMGERLHRLRARQPGGGRARSARRWGTAASPTWS